MIGSLIGRHPQIGELAVALQALEKRLDDRDAYRQAALHAALEANNHRLDTMNEFRSAIADQAAMMITRKESEEARRVISDKSEAGFQVVHATIDAELRPIKERIDHLMRPNWTLMTSFLSIALVVIAGTYTIVGLKIDTAIAPGATAIVALQEHNRQTDALISVVTNRSTDSIQADLISKGDRAQLNTRLTEVEQSVTSNTSDRRAAEATTKAALIEIETQFKSASVTANLEKDATQQKLGLLWFRVYKEPLPPTPYRPNLYHE